MNELDALLNALDHLNHAEEALAGVRLAGPVRNALQAARGETLVALERQRRQPAGSAPAAWPNGCW